MPTKLLISQLPKTVESYNWYQMIVRIMFYDYMTRYIKESVFLVVRILMRSLKYKRKITEQWRGYGIMVIYMHIATGWRQMNPWDPIFSIINIKSSGRFLYVFPN